jgi:hypothetical protein
LRLSVRQFKRLKARVRALGVEALAHRGRGQPSPRRLSAERRAQVVALMTTTYDGFNDVHLTEKLHEEHALPVSRATVRRLRLALGRPARRRRRAPKHRARRERAPALGELVQLDASFFAWLEARGPAATLHGLIADATSRPLALWLRPTEDRHGYLTVLGHTCRTFGVPVTLYGDRLNVFVRNDRHWTLEEELRGQRDPTHFGRVLADLGIGFIQARSPQAKGRIERLWGTLPDRLVSELRVRGIATLDAANAFLPQFLTDFARRFAGPPASPTPAWRPAPRDLDRVLSCRYDRTVARDNTVRLGPRTIPIPPGPGGRSYAGVRVEVRELLDGRAVVVYQHAVLTTQPAPSADFRLVPRTHPSAARTGQPRGRARRATDPASGDTARTPRVGATRNDDPAGGRYLGIPPNPPVPAVGVPRRAGTVSTPAATHPWRQPFSRRERARQRARLEG